MNIRPASSRAPTGAVIRGRHGVGLLACLALLLALQSCGGGGGGGGGGGDSAAPAVSLTPTTGRVSGDSPVAAACTGGGAVGVLFANAEVEPSLARSPTNP